MRPDERLVKKRTGSSASRVGPAVTSTFFPVRSPGVKARSTASRMVSSSAMCPLPTSLQASKPTFGSMNCARSKVLSVCMLRWVTGFSYILLFIAGAMSSGARVAMTVVVSISSATPDATLPMKFALAGATRNTSARLASAMCSTSHLSGRANISTTAGFPVRVSMVCCVMKLVAFLVKMQ